MIFSLQLLLLEMVVRIVSVACASSTTAASAVLALQRNNEFLLDIKRQRKNAIEEINAQQQFIKLNTKSVWLQGSLEKLLGKLQSRFSKAKGGAERKKLKMRTCHVTLQKEDVINVAAAIETDRSIYKLTLHTLKVLKNVYVTGGLESSSR